MLIAVDEAKKAYRKFEVPVGCVIVKNDKVVAKAHNLREKYNSLLGHAEIIAINKATKKLKNWRLDGCDMYVTLEPCNMCKAIIEESRLNNVFYCIKKDKNVVNKTIFSVSDCECDEILSLMKNFFNNIRNY